MDCGAEKKKEAGRDGGDSKALHVLFLSKEELA
jgi:hypothetical protein